jgi:SAM-dependent methyltransferase
VNGAYYLPYQAHATSEQFHKAYPWAKKLFKLKDKLDPDFRFRNIIWDTYYKEEKAKDIWIKWKETSEFISVFQNTYWRDQFYLFLQNVYRIYPEDAFHYLIKEASVQYNTDEAIYNNISKRLCTIKPFLVDVTYALPALKKQKLEMLNQTKELLWDGVSINGYVEIGTTGRYVNYFKKTFNIRGNIFTINDSSADNSLAEIFERWQISKVSKHLDFKNYTSNIEKQSVDLITCFVWLHHVPIEKLAWFIKNIHSILKPGGKFILRDHDADSKEMEVFCSLLHTVFNLGLWVSFEEDQKEYRNFHSIVYWSKLLKKHGFQDSWKRILQHKDPSKNTLLIFTKK